MSSDSITYMDLLKAIKQDLDEEIASIEPLVNDPDKSCPARQLRSERLRTLEGIRLLLNQYDDWEWAVPVTGRDTLT